MNEIGEIGLDEIAGLKAKAAKERRRAAGLSERRSDEAVAQRVSDGRVRPAATNKDGHVQLNVRVTPDLKNRVIEAAQAGGGDMSKVVSAALRAYFKSRDA